MAIESILGSVQGANPRSPAAIADKVEIFEQDGQLLVSGPKGESHPLTNEHCYNCVTGFESLQSAARRGADGGLFELAVQQTKQRQKALGVAAGPGAGPLRGLTPSGAIPETDNDVREEQTLGRVREEDSVKLSRSGMLRATGAEVASLGTGVRTADGESPAETGRLESTAGLDAHGHPHDAVKAVESAHAADPDSHQDDLESGENAKTEHVDKLERELSDDEQAKVLELQQRDTEVRAHEQAHKAAGGQHAGAINLSYETGPDGRKYAVAGEVPVDISPISGDPRATVQKMQTIQRAALAPADPSSADRQVAARAAQYANEARMELVVEEKEAPKAPPKTAPIEDGETDAVGPVAGPTNATTEGTRPAEPGTQTANGGQAGATEAAGAVGSDGVSADATDVKMAPPAPRGIEELGGIGPASENSEGPGAAKQKIAMYGRGGRSTQFTQSATFNAFA